jgi:hypothetical protein
VTDFFILVLEGGNLQAIEKSDFLKKSPPLKWSGNFRHPVLVQRIRGLNGFFGILDYNPVNSQKIIIQVY